MNTSNRLLSLDILRGITIVGMILVNNPGTWGYIYAPLKHASWNGLTPADLVFPFFMFIMGISTFISLQKYHFQFSKELLYKIIKRTVVIFFLGVAIAWLALCFKTYHGLADEPIGFVERCMRSLVNFSDLRILGVLQRLALTYGITSLIAILVKHKYIPYLIAVLLISYFLLMVFGHAIKQGEWNILSMVDKAVLGSGHMNSPGFDPEGIVSTLSALCNVLIGFCCGKMLMEVKENNQRMTQLFITGTILTLAGFLFAYGCPINKNIWSSTFVLVTCGLGASLLALLIWIVDIKGYKRWGVFFESFGVNPLFIYVFSQVLMIILDGIQIPYDDRSLSIKTFLYKTVFQPYFGNYFGSFVYALIFVLATWLIGHVLYKKHIYIKI